jgi:hypothetical protein
MPCRDFIAGGFLGQPGFPSGVELTVQEPHFLRGRLPAGFLSRRCYLPVVRKMRGVVGFVRLSAGGVAQTWVKEDRAYILK